MIESEPVTSDSAQVGWSTADAMAVQQQLGRPGRGVHAVAHRCPCGLPDVVETLPRLSNGAPFPTVFYLTCPLAVAAVSRLEADGLMREQTARLAADPDLLAAHHRAHDAYLLHRDVLAERSGVGPVPEIAGISAGGMPDRVKCLHVLLAHALAAGSGVNPLGDEVRHLLEPWWTAGPCVGRELDAGAVEPQA
jgi:hypothetical protein